MLDPADIHCFMRQQTTVHAVLLDNGRQYMTIPVQLTAMAVDPNGEFFLDGVTSSGGYYPAIPLSLVWTNRLAADLCAAYLNLTKQLFRDTRHIFKGSVPLDPDRISQIISPVPFEQYNLYSPILDKEVLYDWCGVDRPSFPDSYLTLLITDRNKQLASNALHIVQTNLRDHLQVMYTRILSQQEETGLLNSLVLLDRNEERR